MEQLTVEKMKEKIKELQGKLNNLQYLYDKYKGEYIVIEKENLYMKVRDIGLDDDGEPCLFGDCICLNTRDFYIDINSELGLNWGWVDIKMSSKEEFEKAVDGLANRLKETLG